MLKAVYDSFKRYSGTFFNFGEIRFLLFAESVIFIKVFNIGHLRVLPYLAVSAGNA
jgi:hypothetical protein